MKTLVIDIADATDATPSTVAAAQSFLDAGDRVCLFHDIFHARMDDDQGHSDNDIIAEARNLLVSARRRQLEQLAKLLPSNDVHIQVNWTDNGWQSLITHVSEQQADMLVVQSDRPARWRPLARANKDWQLIRYCPVPLLLTRPECSHEYAHILATVDPLHADDKPAELDHRILAHAAAITVRHDASLCVFNVAAPATSVNAATTIPVLNMDVPTADILAAHRTRVQSMVRNLNCKVDKVCVIAGVPAHEIVAHARQNRVDLVVMGAVARSALRNLLIGNTAEKVLDQLSADTLIIRPGAKLPQRRVAHI